MEEHEGKEKLYVVSDQSNVTEGPTILMSVNKVKESLAIHLPERLVMIVSAIGNTVHWGYPQDVL